LDSSRNRINNATGDLGPSEYVLMTTNSCKVRIYGSSLLLGEVQRSCSSSSSTHEGRNEFSAGPCLWWVRSQLSS